MMQQDIKKLNAISQSIFDKKGFNILVLDIRHLSSMADYFIIAEGSVGRHVKSLSTSIKHQIASLHTPLYRVDGEKEGDWVVMDLGDIVIHLFTPDMREKYALEEMWSHAKIIDVEIIINNEALKLTN